MACGLWKKNGKEPGCVVHPGSFLLRRGGRVWGNGVSELPSRRLPISQKPLGRGPGEDLSEERSFLPSPRPTPPSPKTFPFIESLFVVWGVKKGRALCRLLGRVIFLIVLLKSSYRIYLQ